LDIGCGLAKRGSINIDLNREVKPDIVADAKYLPFRDSRFDKLFAFSILEHVYEPRKYSYTNQYYEQVYETLKEWGRVLKVGGVLELLVPNFGSLQVLLAWIKQDVNLIPQIMGGHWSKYDVHHYLFTFKYIKKVLSDSGFQILKVEPEFSLENIKNRRVREFIKRIFSIIFKYRSMNVHVLAIKVSKY
jgi:predicted SAM-dependent methyltransferase